LAYDSGVAGSDDQTELIRKLPLGSQCIPRLAVRPLRGLPGEYPEKSAGFVRSVSFNLTSR